jgi:hypothetical protein
VPGAARGDGGVGCVWECDGDAVVGVEAVELNVRPRVQTVIARGVVAKRSPREGLGFIALGNLTNDTAPCHA